MNKQQDFRKKIFETFKIEASENIGSMSSYLLELENGVGNNRKNELYEVLYRAAHSLKGAARAVDYEEVESLCHAFEDVMSAIRNDEIVFNSRIFDALFHTVDLIESILNSDSLEVSPDLSDAISIHLENLSLVEAGLEYEVPKPKPKNDKVEINKIQHETPIIIDSFLTTENTNSEKKKNLQIDSRKAVETVRISASRMNSLLTQTEELLTLKLAGINRTENLQNTLNKIVNWNKKSSSAVVSTNNLNQCLSKNVNLKTAQNNLDEIVNFCNWSKSQMNVIESELTELLIFSQNETYSTNLKIDSLLADVKKLIMVPFNDLLDGFPKMIRDISKDLGKEAELSIEGENIEIDRRILDEIRSPLIHILRNAIDYGIESPDLRLKKNKPVRGNIKIKIEQPENNKIELVVSDDGAGINIEKLKNIYSKNEQIDKKNSSTLSRKELLSYIFRSGISTSDLVTDLSGRGLGMAIAQDTIEKLGGTIEVETEENKSTTFTIQLPLSVVTYRGVLFNLSGRKFIVPTQKIKQVLMVNQNSIKTINNKATISFNNEVVPLINLSEILEIQEKKNETEFIQVMVFELRNKRIAFVIDEVIREQEVLVKKFNKQLSRVRNILGATILGSGEVVPILNINDLFKSSVKNNFNVHSFSALKETVEKQKKSVLIVEDSITSRTLLKNILEGAKYNVTAAIDGVDGYTKFKEGNFDIVISDVEMPRMNGFELTAKIRSGKESSEIPVVLITSLSKREDREKGIDVGANAYIIKSNFDQSNLLEVLSRLI